MVQPTDPQPTNRQVTTVTIAASGVIILWVLFVWLLFNPQTPFLTKASLGQVSYPGETLQNHCDPYCIGGDCYFPCL
ncbi:hypothetical protein BCR44DRAFT_1432544 [Catenaria anguillulae PL171]|uniref:Uncharacterized protein n=1 Tax=Catenaria anguillulae PL171 TaxID=765915 RepID=A0A1Y2HP29_9FUNG|nr:hypothetical protein BCR44DRAFT_1432544 [Catenaria anguillulae PL171]